MAANLSPEYQAAEKKYKSSIDPKDKLEALQEMLRAIPKHKGTEKMQADLKTKISKMRKETQKAGEHLKVLELVSSAVAKGRWSLLVRRILANLLSLTSSPKLLLKWQITPIPPACPHRE